MANIGTDKYGTRYVQFEDRHRQRRTMRLGKCSQRDAESVRLRIEKIVAAQVLDNTPDAETVRWLAEIGDKLSEKFAKLGLIESRQSTTLGAFIESYKASRGDVKPSTRAAWEAPYKSLLAHFGERKPLRAITEGDAKAWRRSMKGLAENTVRKRTAIVKSLFNSAVEHRLIDRNPFAGLKATMVENKARMFHLGPVASARIAEAMPTPEWRVIFALCRWGALRCPSEVLALKWGDVLWDRGRLIVRSPKTEHIPGKASRIIPLFPELLAALQEAFDAAEPGTVYVVTKTRDAGVNLRTRFAKYVERAGYKPWPKLFQNLRSTRETELARQFPLHVVTEWCGNSRPIAIKHYLQV
ncbi:MAG TPA: tyrosine-type recombinase/integrase, partial [Lacipirellulaceae bacterium]|nr:tyrosine-type recombinase/integrase [Lacipirellulaceae bacterium]